MDRETVQLHVMRNRKTGACWVSIEDLIPWLSTFIVEDDAMDQLRLLTYEAAEGEPIRTLEAVEVGE